MKKSTVSLLITGLILLTLSNGYSESLPYAGSSSGGMFAIQLAAFLNESAAEKEVVNLKNKGYDPYIFQSLNSKNQTVYAVRIGKYAGYQAAADELQKVQSDLGVTVQVSHYDSLELAALDTKTSASDFRADAGYDPPPSSQQNENQFSAVAPDAQGGTVESENEAPPTLENLQKRINELESTIGMLRGESDVRKQLQVTEEEAKAEEKDILEAAGQEYTLTTAGNIQFSYGFGYTYDQYDAVRASTRIEPVNDHEIDNSFSISYGIRDNLSLGASIPFIYAYQRVGTVDSKSVTDLGDLSLSWQFQPIKSGTDLPTIIINGGFLDPTGRSPYDIQVGEELSTGSGLYQASLGVSVSQVSDPVVVFSSFSYNYPLTVSDINQKRTEGTLMEVNPGDSLGIGAGMGYALSYKLNMNASVGYSYAFNTEYYYKDSATATSGTSAAANLNLGVGYKISRSQSLNFRIGIPITTQDRTFSFLFWTPIEFKL